MRAKGVASVPWIVERRTGRAANAHKWERDYGHSLELLLSRPNEQMSSNYLMHFQSMHLDTGGNALFKKLRAGGRYRELWPLNPVRAENIVDESGNQVGYFRIQEKQGTKDIPVDMVIHAQRPNPLNPYWGMSPLQSLAYTVDADVAMVRANRSLANNNNMPPAVITDQNIKTPQQLIETQEALDVRWSQDLKGKPLVLPNGTHFLRLALTPQELDYLASREWNVREICAPFDVLPSIFDPTSATYSNLSASIEYMWEAGVIPQLGVIRDALNLGLISREESSTLRVTYDLSEVKALKVQFTRAVADFRTLVQTGVPGTVANERTKVGLPKYLNDDVSYPPVKGGVAPDGSSADAATPTTAGNAAGGETGVGGMPAGGDPAPLGTPNSPSTANPNQSGKSVDSALIATALLLQQVAATPTTTTPSV
jgi:HK97 family phage portal protein